MSRYSSLLARTALVALALHATGCTTSRKAKIDEVGLSYEPRNFAGVERWPADVRRVALLPAADVSLRLPIAFLSSFDPPWLQALQQTQRAEIVPVDRSTYSRWTGGPQVPVSTALLPADWLERVRTTTGADAAMLLDITYSSAYPPLALGVRAKLVHLGTGEVIWTVDELFNAADPDVARGARRHARAGALGRQGETIAVLQSPTKFATYVMETVANTLPRR